MFKIKLNTKTPLPISTSLAHKNELFGSSNLGTSLLYVCENERTLFEILIGDLLFKTVRKKEMYEHKKIMN